MPTFGGLADTIIGELHARTNSQEQLATLVADIGAYDTSFQIDNLNAPGLGLYEIEDELVYASSGSTANGAMVVPAWGRAQQGTVQVSHSAGVKVIRAPRFPRKVVKDMILEAIAQLYPDLYTINTTQITASWITPQYDVTPDCVRILSVEYQVQGHPSRQWIGLRRWRLDRQAPTDQFPTGVTVSLADLPYPNTLVRITYAGVPAVLVNDWDDFTFTGLRAAAADLPRLAVLARMVVAPEVVRGQLSSAEQSERSQLVQTGSTTSVARYFQTLYATKLRIEQLALRSQVPIRVVRTWA